MRVILDTNILLSALLSPHGAPALLIDAWRAGRFTLITSRDQLLEFGGVARRPVMLDYIVPAQVGRFINDLRQFAEVLTNLLKIERSPDPADDFLLAMAEAGAADYLVTGDRHDLLQLCTHGRTRIVSARGLATVLDL
ncbi:MAG: putative toxin-antitoxin system toxin component, PIN family [Gammaproteobacteria bacterium]|nr:putative toxin-antitoxin system toxin component, PIN family [Gammaproteobacteria bacterium]